MKPHLLLYTKLTILLFMVNANAASLIFNTQDLPPFNFQVKGMIRGPVAEIIRKVCYDLSISCKLNLLPWRRAVKEVKAGKAHGLFVIGKTQKRLKWLYFSPPIISSEYGFFVNKQNSLNYKSKKDIINYKIVVYGPSNLSYSLDSIKKDMVDHKLPSIEIIMFPDDINIFKMLNESSLPTIGAYSNKDVGKTIMQELNLNNIRYAGKDKNIEYYIGFNKKNTPKQTVDKFNHKLIEFYRHGTITKILNKYRITPAKM